MLFSSSTDSKHLIDLTNRFSSLVQNFQPTVPVKIILTSPLLRLSRLRKQLRERIQLILIRHAQKRVQAAWGQLKVLGSVFITEKSKTMKIT